MADVSALPTTDWGSLLTSYGRNTADQQLTQAQTGLVQQQQQQAAYINQMTQAGLPLIMDAINKQQQENAVTPDQTDQSAGASPAGTVQGPDDQSGNSAGNTTTGTPNAGVISAPPINGAPPGAGPVAALTGAVAAPGANLSVGGTPATPASPPVMVNGQPQPAPTPGMPADSAQNDSTGGTNPQYLARADNAMRQKYFVNSAGTPQEQQAIMRWAGLSGLPGPMGQFAQGQLEKAKLARELGVQSRKATSNKNASNDFDAWSSVVSAKDHGVRPLEALDAVQKSAANRIRSAESDPDKQDADAVSLASHMAANVHMYTDRPVETRADGVQVDAVTKIPVPGAERSRLSVQQRHDLWDKSVMAPIPVKDPNTGVVINMAAYRAPVNQNGLGMTDPYAAFNHLRYQMGDLDADPTLINNSVNRGIMREIRQYNDSENGPVGPHVNPNGIAPTTNPGTFRLASGKQIPVPAQPIDPVSQQPVARAPLTDPDATDQDKMNWLMSDPSYNTRNVRGVAGTPQNPYGGKIGGEGGIQDRAEQAYWPQRQQVLDEANQMTSATSQGLAALHMAKAVMDGADLKGLNVSGLPGDIASKISTTLGSNLDAATARQEILKSLTQAAQARTSEIYSKAPSNYQSKLTVEDAFPNISLNDPAALRHLVNQNIAGMEYEHTKANFGASQYVRLGRDPGQFGTAYENNLPRSNWVSKRTAQLDAQDSTRIGNTGNLPSYNSEGEARAAGHKGGDRVVIGGVTGTLRD